MNITTAAELEAALRSTLLYPDNESPNRVQTWHAINSNAQLLFLQGQNTRCAWSISSFILPVSAGQSDYVIPAMDFGKDLLVETIDESDPYHVAREIPRIDLQDKGLWYNSTGRANAANWTASAFSFYRSESGVPMVKIIPESAGSVSYKVWYETTDGEFSAYSSAFKFPQFIHLLRYKTALELLPYCRWSSLSLQEAQMRASSLAMVMEKKEAEYQRAFDDYISSTRDEGSFERAGYGDGNSESYFFL